MLLYVRDWNFSTSLFPSSLSLSSPLRHSVSISFFGKIRDPTSRIVSIVWTTWPSLRPFSWPGSPWKGKRRRKGRRTCLAERKIENEIRATNRAECTRAKMRQPKRGDGGRLNYARSAGAAATRYIEFETGEKEKKREKKLVYFCPAVFPRRCATSRVAAFSPRRGGPAAANVRIYRSRTIVRAVIASDIRKRPVRFHEWNGFAYNDRER